MQFRIIGPRLPPPVLDTRSPSQRAADMIAAIDHVVTSPSERAAAAIATIDRALRTSVPTTSCWFCGNPLTPNEVGLPCPACGDGNGRHRQPRAAHRRQARQLAGRVRLADAAQYGLA
jgi:predicted RNA-binding Zn-ribbon protein involved in translation (DUF1610 family)